MTNILLARVLNSISLGSTYALLASGFNLLLLVAGVIQFAYPHIVVLSMYACWGVLRATGDNVALGVAAGVGASVGLSIFSETLFRPLVKRGATVGTFIFSLAIALILTDIMARQINFGNAVSFPVTLEGKEPLVRFGIAIITRGQLATIIGSIGGMVLLLYIVYRTKLGRAFRAMAQSSFLARLLGIPIVKTSLYSYLIAGLLGGASAVFLAMTLGSAVSSLGNQLAVKVIAVVLFAGLGNLRGGVIAGVILGFAETFAIAYIPGDWVNAIAFAMIMGAVMWRPEGLFGVRT